MPSLDEDRILRSFSSLVTATVRTNHHQPGPDGADKLELALKLDPTGILDMPLPRPVHEIFVYSPAVEGVHLRAGDVARGGIRWSDRREDFRTEILGLMKAQMVKNAVIVPVGAKGGFIAKRLTPMMRADEVAAEVLAAYRSFIGALLDVTDNLVDGEVVPPDGVVRHDGDDPYLVVAADKGTASFSDHANEISLARRFWLRDAFASGGSSGYDHKAMGITARGAWESVERHFRELGVDTRTQPFTAVGIGDMSGDVFGNGALLSPCLRLVAAFDHRHVFVDPDPDPETSLGERRRLFELPRSSWADYDATLISTGGGVFERAAKSVAITPELRGALGIEDGVDALTPNQLIQRILAAPVDLLWNGGVGTFVKASTEPHAEAGDRANEAIRVDAADLRCRVIGEGGNLGLTQRARVEFALGGGKVYSDAVDNSAGVNCSDHEVNIKILLNRVVDDGDLTMKQRDRLLVEMTGDVAALVLEENYHQTEAISAATAQAPGMVEVHQRHLQWLERIAGLDRRLEALPSDEELNERRTHDKGLTAPELSVVMAYTKIVLAQALVQSDLPDDAECTDELLRYFPAPIQERYPDQVAAHPLARQLVATIVTNRLVDRAGLSMTYRLAERDVSGHRRHRQGAPRRVADLRARVDVAGRRRARQPGIRRRPAAHAPRDEAPRRAGHQVAAAQPAAAHRRGRRGRAVRRRRPPPLRGHRRDAQRLRRADGAAHHGAGRARERAHRPRPGRRGHGAGDHRARHRRDPARHRSPAGADGGLLPRPRRRAAPGLVPPAHRGAAP